MILRSKVLLATAFTLAVLAVIALEIRVLGIRVSPPPLPLTLEGSVLTQNTDPSERTPLPGVTVTASTGTEIIAAKSDPSGYFSLTLNSGIKKGQAVSLTFHKQNYKNVEITSTTPGDQLYIAQMQLLQPTPEAKRNRLEAPVKITVIKDVRVRYSFKDEATIGVGSSAKQFVALNLGDVPCRGQRPCSPDGRWKATVTTLPLDAEPGNEFRNVRVSCIAGPCHFTKIDSNAFAQPARLITISVLNWSDTTDFLVEADVIRTMRTDMVRQSYPFVVGDTMNFTMPPSSEGPSIEADLNGQQVVFPLGPSLFLSWASCNVQISPDKNKIYRCQLKPGYRF